MRLSRFLFVLFVCFPKMQDFKPQFVVIYLYFYLFIYL